MVYGIYNELVTGAYKPTQNWGGHIVPELVVLCLCFSWLVFIWLSNAVFNRIGEEQQR